MDDIIWISLLPSYTKYRAYAGHGVKWADHVMLMILVCFALLAGAAKQSRPYRGRNIIRDVYGPGIA